MTATDPIVIVSAARTPMGGLQGDFKNATAPQLGGEAIKAAVARSGIASTLIDEVVMGCVLPAGLGQAPARQAAINAGLPLSVNCAVVSKVCGSGMKAAMVGHDALVAGSSGVVVVGGMESMSNAPYLLPKARGGYRMGHGSLLDHMFFDGLEDAYFDRGRLMGTFAEDCAEAYRFSRDDQDDWAMTSLVRAQNAIRDGAFDAEVVSVTVKSGRAETLVSHDEQPLKADMAKIRALKPAFKEGGTVTAANASSISDGAAALVLTRRSRAEALGLPPLATIVGHASFSGRPNQFPTAPVGAMRPLLERLDWKASDVDFWEINEAFAVVPLVAIRELGLDPEVVNVRGGACALGHPIGASGARILVTLLSALKREGRKRGVASLCIGGGEATAMAIELI